VRTLRLEPPTRLSIVFVFVFQLRARTHKVAWAFLPKDIPLAGIAYTLVFHEPLFHSVLSHRPPRLAPVVVDWIDVFAFWTWNGEPHRPPILPQAVFPIFLQQPIPVPPLASFIDAPECLTDRRVWLLSKVRATGALRVTENVVVIYGKALSMNNLYT
jgi:hypothetical protein